MSQDISQENDDGDESADDREQTISVVIEQKRRKLAKKQRAIYRRRRNVAIESFNLSRVLTAANRVLSLSPNEILEVNNMNDWEMIDEESVEEASVIEIPAALQVAQFKIISFKVFFFLNHQRNLKIQNNFLSEDKILFELFFRKRNIHSEYRIFQTAVLYYTFSH
jgi:hypothetical protein